MRSFKDWMMAQESSPFTRSRMAAFWGLGPKIASPFSHSTPVPAVAEKLVDDLKDDKKKSKHKDKKKDKDEDDDVSESKTPKTPNYSFDNWLQQKKAEQEKNRNDIDKAVQDEIGQGEKRAKSIDKEVTKDKSKPPKKPFEKDPETSPKPKSGKKPSNDKP